jgi:hypothetical protein
LRSSEGFKRDGERGLMESSFQTTILTPRVLNSRMAPWGLQSLGITNIHAFPPFIPSPLGVIDCTHGRKLTAESCSPSPTKHRTPNDRRTSAVLSSRYFALSPSFMQHPQTHGITFQLTWLVRMAAGVTGLDFGYCAAVSILDLSNKDLRVRWSVKP